MQGTRGLTGIAGVATSPLEQVGDVRVGRLPSGLESRSGGYRGESDQEGDDSVGEHGDGENRGVGEIKV
jgi:hypothetical protein